MALNPAGYSGTPLARKLGLKDGQAVGFVDLPEGLSELRVCRAFASVENLRWSAVEQARDLDVLHVFARLRAVLEDHAKALLAAIRRDGMIWVSWPKKASKVATDVTEDVLREILLPVGLVDVKVCAVDEVWSGLKFVIRKELR